MDSMFDPSASDIPVKSEYQTLYKVIAVIFLLVVLGISGFLFYLCYKSFGSGSEGFDGFNNFKNISTLGVCYDYDAPIYTSKSTDCSSFKALLDADFSKIKSMGFDSVRTYWPNMGGQKGCQCNATDISGAYTEMASKHDLKILLGVGTDIYKSNKWGIADCVKHIVNSPTVIGLLIGNEDVNGDTGKAGDIINAYNELKPLTKVPIGTAQQYGFWLKGSDGKHKQPYDRLVAALDFCGANIYADPFPGSQDPDRNKQSIIASFEKARESLGNKLWITEVGIPHSGNNSTTGFNQGLQDSFIKDVLTWNNQSGNNIPIFLFQAFDEPNKQDNDPNLNVEKYFGILQHK